MIKQRKNKWKREGDGGKKLGVREERERRGGEKEKSDLSARGSIEVWVRAAVVLPDPGGWR